jgi:DNA-binding transcriptional LysR family regulator
MQRRPPVNNVPIELLRAIVAIVDLGSFTKAAQALNLTQPAISAQMKRLQQLVGAEVFSKSGSGLVPTARGELVVKYARRILAMNDQILSLGGGQTHAQSLRVGLPLLFTRAVLGDVMKIGSDEDGEPEIQIFCDSSEELRRRLAAGYLDVAFIINPQEAPPQVVTEWTEPWIWVCASDFVLKQGAKIPLIVTPTDRYTIEVVERIGRPYVIRFMAPSLGARMEAMRTGLGFMSIAERLVTEDMKIVGSNVLPPFPETLAGIYLREGLELGSLAKFIEAFVAVCKPPSLERPSFGWRVRTGSIAQGI